MKENKTPLYIFAYYLSSVPVIVTHTFQKKTVLCSPVKILKNASIYLKYISYKYENVM